jgi:hypothetical protein
MYIFLLFLVLKKLEMVELRQNDDSLAIEHIEKGVKFVCVASPGCV